MKGTLKFGCTAEYEMPASLRSLIKQKPICWVLIEDLSTTKINRALSNRWPSWLKQNENSIEADGSCVYAA